MHAHVHIHTHTHTHACTHTRVYTHIPAHKYQQQLCVMVSMKYINYNVKGSTHNINNLHVHVHSIPYGTVLHATSKFLQNLQVRTGLYKFLLNFKHFEE